VPTDSPGLSRHGLALVDGTGAARLQLADAPAEPIAATPDQIADSIARASAAASAQMLGIMERMLADTLDHVKTRQQFGVAIGSFQTIQHRVARLYVATGLCRSLVLAAAVGEAGGARADWLTRVAAAQAMLGEQAMHLAHECVQFHGGMGITAELALARGHAQLMVLARLFGGPATARRMFRERMDHGSASTLHSVP
jgi:alkylation response protein AidB-like acyl-CoA dehydrogenase